MRIVFGYNKSPKEFLTKSVNWPDSGDREGSLVNGTSILDPEILVSAGSGSFTGINYFYIPDFGRYYFVTGQESVRTGLVKIRGHVDVLTSYRTEIIDNYAIFSNLEQKNARIGYNKYINDGTFKVYQDRYIIDKYPFSGGFSASEYVLAMAGS